MFRFVLIIIIYNFEVSFEKTWLSYSKNDINFLKFYLNLFETFY
jgi:hypothetical protein